MPILALSTGLPKGMVVLSMVVVILNLCGGDRGPAEAQGLGHGICYRENRGTSLGNINDDD